MDTVTIDRLKRAYGDAAEPSVPAQPPKRGRPPNAVPIQPPPPPLPPDNNVPVTVDPARDNLVPAKDNLVPVEDDPAPTMDDREFPPLSTRGRARRRRQFYEPELGSWVAPIIAGRLIWGGLRALGVCRSTSGGAVARRGHWDRCQLTFISVAYCF